MKTMILDTLAVVSFIAAMVLLLALGSMRCDSTERRSHWSTREWQSELRFWTSSASAWS